MSDQGVACLIVCGHPALLVADALVGRFWEGFATVTEMRPELRRPNRPPERVVVEFGRGRPRLTGADGAPPGWGDGPLDPSVLMIARQFSNELFDD